LNEKPMSFLYLAESQVYVAGMIIAARVDGDPLAYGKTIEKAIHGLNGDLDLYDVTTLEEREQFSSFAQRAGGTLVGAFGLLALVLAAVGICGVTAYTTRQRTREIGIRMTLGATKRDVLRLVLGLGFRLTAIGLGVGLAMALALTRFLSGVLLGVTSTDAVTFLSVAILLCAVALFACFLPARRAMRVDPMVALRYE
jgi:putative ABC transport system permease protein